MGRLRIVLLLVSGALLVGAATSGARQDWGYVSVRERAQLFWWLFYSEREAGGNSSAPLVLWLQGGPGASGCGFGNFEEIGPLDVDLNPRNYSWVQAASLLFVDNPVGAGYSYTTDSGAFAKDLDTVVKDMMVLLQNFFQHKPEFQNVPFYIFSESYGGKMAAAIGLELLQAVLHKKVKCHFAGVALGDSWISPLDSVLSWGPFLHSMSLLDDRGLDEVGAAAAEVQAAIEAGHYQQATELWAQTEDVIERCTAGVNFYNILKERSPEQSPRERSHHMVSLFQRHVRPLQHRSLAELMNGPIRKKLKIIPDFVEWGGQANEVFRNMEGDFMKPVIDTVDQLLAAGVNVTVYNGQLDLIVDSLGQEAWVRKLKWQGLPVFSSQQWTPLYTKSHPTSTAAFYKHYHNFGFFWVLKAGHMIPADQPEMALQLLRVVTGQ
ncbi:retinoid-inducible serine carboxypeptidase isoform X2 [Hypanus sabinus]|uniref:retinoid-inducible serine carboxypeptidase isoform X2 n=1 Tax=Hypanus sabinus TaxID=79690 RepID=UPI0028C48F6B|nr:retinoid-inducible serine carboxypeptidase isoform X2 [Hypanus sabinus]